MYQKRRLTGHEKVQSMKNKLSEMSAAGASAVEGSMDVPEEQEKENDLKATEEQEIFVEFVDNKLRQYLKELDFFEIVNESTPISKVSKNSTGLNELDTLLQNILPTLENAYKNLTTSEDQRKEFRAYIINGVTNILKNAVIDRSEVKRKEKEELSEKKVSIDKNRYKNLDVEKGETLPTEEENDFDVLEKGLSISSEDQTGKNVALKIFKNISNQIVDSFSTLDNSEDQKIFFKYLLLNLKKWFDTWEDELNIDLGN